MIFRSHCRPESDFLRSGRQSNRGGCKQTAATPQPNFPDPQARGHDTLNELRTFTNHGGRLRIFRELALRARGHAVGLSMGDG